MDCGAIRFVRRERIRIYSFFCSSKVMTKWKNSRVISSSYTRYEDCQSSYRVNSPKACGGGRVFSGPVIRGTCFGCCALAEKQSAKSVALNARARLAADHRFLTAFTE